MPLSETKWDVVVLGGGNAALCAAITAAAAGAKILILEAAPKALRGGNTRHTRNLRCAHKKPLSNLPDSYGEDEYFDDLLRVTAGNTDKTLARMTIADSEPCLSWMAAQGVRFQPSLPGTLGLSRTNAFFLGGGKALLNAYYNQAADLGITCAYDAEVTHVHIDNNRAAGVEVSLKGKLVTIRARALVLASGGFQANLKWLASAWGPGAKNFLVRGTPYNQGTILRDMLDQGAVAIGEPDQCHAVAIDGRAPKFDGGIVTRLDCIPFSVVVNCEARRFYDEGEDLWPNRYAIWGRLVAAQPAQIAYAIFDAKSTELFMPTAFPPICAQSLHELAERLELPAEILDIEISAYNAACQPGEFNPSICDGLATAGLTPAKSNWARPIDQPPFCAYPLRPGITFTYLGLKVDARARVQGPAGTFENIWAAGEIMAGSLLGQGYLAGFGMTIGTVFGRIAGAEAANHVK